MVKPVEVKVEDMQGFEVAYVRHVGPYQGDGALFESLWGKLMRWAGTRGLMMPETKMLVIYHDNPEVTDSDKLRISVCISVPEGTPVEGEVGKMSIPGGENMFAQFVIGIQEYGAAWAYVFSEWFPSSGYQPDERPSFEMYPQGGCDDPSKHKVTIVVPVMPL